MIRITCSGFDSTASANQIARDLQEAYAAALEPFQEEVATAGGEVNLTITSDFISSSVEYRNLPTSLIDRINETLDA